MSFALPISRSSTYVASVPGVPGSQVKAGDLNTIQDLLTGAIPHFFEDFFCINTELWTVVADGTGGVIPDVTIGQYGAIRAQTDNTLNHTAQIQSVTTLGILAGGLPSFRARIMFRTNATSRLDTFALFDGTSTDYFGFTRDTGTSNNIKLIVMGGSGLETFDTGIAPTADTWYVLTARMVDSGHCYWEVAADAFSAPISSGTATLAHAVTTTTALGARSFLKSLTASSRVQITDYISVSSTTTR